MADVYALGNRPRCSTCNVELEPAPSRSDGEPTFCGFFPCPDHPRAKVRYVLAERLAHELAAIWAKLGPLQRMTMLEDATKIVYAPYRVQRSLRRRGLVLVVGGMPVFSDLGRKLAMWAKGQKS